MIAEVENGGLRRDPATHETWLSFERWWLGTPNKYGEEPNGQACAMCRAVRSAQPKASVVREFDSVPSKGKQNRIGFSKKGPDLYMTVESDSTKDAA